MINKIKYIVLALSVFFLGCASSTYTYRDLKRANIVRNGIYKFDNPNIKKYNLLVKVGDYFDSKANTRKKKFTMLTIPKTQTNYDFDENTKGTITWSYYHIDSEKNRVYTTILKNGLFGEIMKKHPYAISANSHKSEVHIKYSLDFNQAKYVTNNKKIMAILKQAKSKNNSAKDEVMKYTCKDHEKIVEKLASLAEHQFYYSYNSVDKLSNAKAQLFLIKQKKAIGEYSREFHKKQQIYNTSKIVAKSKHCDTSSYPLSPIAIFNLGIEILQDYDKKGLFINREKIKNENDFFHKHKKLTLVKENHANIDVSNTKYVLDSYIIMFENPYYITIKREDGGKMSYENAVNISTDYIKPRGCTSPIKHLKNLSKCNKSMTKCMVVMSC